MLEDVEESILESRVKRSLFNSQRASQLSLSSETLGIQKKSHFYLC